MPFDWSSTESEDRFDGDDKDIEDVDSNDFFNSEIDSDRRSENDVNSNDNEEDASSNASSVWSQYNIETM